MPQARTEIEEPTSLTDFSASRLGLASRCGLAFEYKYVKQLPAPFDRGATMFGHAIHDGVQEWYGMDDKPNDFTQQDLAPIVLAQWERLLPEPIWQQVLELRDLDEEREAVAAAIKFRRPTLKAPTQTKEYLESEAVRVFGEKHRAMIETCDARPDVKWPKDEDPYKAYRKSAEIADKMQARWQKKPRPIAVERPFSIEIEGFRVRGRLDQLRQDPHPNTGEQLLCNVDIKTGRNALTQMEAFLQAFIYCEAIYSFDDLPDTENVAFYLARKDAYQQGQVDRKRHRRIASRIFNGKARQIAMGQFEPSYGFWCDRCDFNDLCSTEISLWKGDGMTVELL